MDVCGHLHGPASGGGGAALRRDRRLFPGAHHPVSYTHLDVYKRQVCAFLGFYAYGFLATLVVNVVGACLFIWLGRRLFG